MFMREKVIIFFKILFERKKINTQEIIPEFIFNKIINQYKIEKVYIKLDNLYYWFN